MFGDLFEQEEEGVGDSGAGERAGGGKEQEPPAPRGPARLSGIRNQGGTCYLNALLQTLLFTPEFREQLFSLEPAELRVVREDGGDAKVRVIPLELQKLFARLLLLDEQAASTTALTDSFGWTNHEEMSQQDVQELNRILFSALESSLIGTSGSSLIQQLYHGTLVNQITCKECSNVSERQEDFLDLTVCVRGMSGLEEALWSMFVEEEVFEGNNLYRCSCCERLVCATKAAKLRKLPPFLTVSLLRFSFDFEKCERYKETSRYSFPLSINLQPYSEQSDLPDSEFHYELFSVIIHKGGCYGGHYHVYIKDLDQLGHWEAPEEDVKEKLKVQKKPQSLFDLPMETEDPLAAVIAVITQEPSGSVLLDQLGQRLMGRIGSSWNKKFKKQFGPISKFLQSRSDVFMLVSNGSRVALNPKYTHTNRPKTAEQQQGAGPDVGLGMDLRVERESELWVEPETDCHWFDLNDSAVTAIREQDIKKQFEGKESAYMLFYRKHTLQRPPHVKGNPAYNVPPHLLEMIQEENNRILQKRAEFDASSNSVELWLHLASLYQVQNGALQPISTNTPPTSMMIDRRRPVGDLRLAICQMQDQWEGDVTLTIAKHLPAGLHLYNTLTDDQQSLYSAGVANDSHLFVWNGSEVKGVQVQVGAEWEPVLLTVMRPQDPGCQPADGSGLQCSSHGFPRALTLDHVREALGPQEVLVCQEEKGVGLDGGGASEWRVCSTEAMRKTLRELTLRDGDALLLLPATHTCDSVFSVNGDLVTVMTPSDCRWLKVKFWPQTAVEEEKEGQIRKIPASGDSLLEEVKQRALDELQLQEQLAGVPCCLRQVDRSGKLLPPVREDLSVRDAGIRLMTSLYLCLGPSPKSSQLFLYCRVSTAPSSVPELELIVEETLSVKECLMEVVRAAGLEGTCWHLRRMDWCEEVGEPLRDEYVSLLEVGVANGDILVLTEGQLPPKGFLKLAVRWCEDLGGESVLLDSVSAALELNDTADRSHTAGWVEVKCVGFVEISEEASLQDLKCQVLTLPALVDVCVPTPEFLRVWLLEDQRATRILKGNTHTLRKLKIVCGSEVCVQKLQCEENLGLKDVLLRVRMGVPGEREYYPSQEFVWDAGRDTSAKGLYSSLSSLYGISPENLLLAKHLPEKHTWMPIHNWTQQVSKRRKKKKVDSLQGAPYCLRDGDLIGVKNLLVDSNREFSTLQDEQAQQRLREQNKSHKKEGCGEVSQEACPEGKTRAAKHRKPEVALSINVGVFR
ncbi:ubiquitin carboxyl-terminal hydrolase 40 isoform X2 [Salminus brasiliensis]|uniref:ubiquitin carboxyl-terminal hydrolase 40 isoform X2 n=1 Tax=Salminus brasiliensis TaxID=930266 RepID=UPI003B830BCF